VVRPDWLYEFIEHNISLMGHLRLRDAGPNLVEDTLPIFVLSGRSANGARRGSESGWGVTSAEPIPYLPLTGTVSFDSLNC
jgi:hypothetical protein